MPPPKKRDKKKQTRLAFESVVDGSGGAGASSSPARPPLHYSPARVRFSDGAASSSSPGCSSPSKPAARGRTSKGKSQSRLHDSTGTSATSTPRQKRPSASFMPKIHGGRQRATLVDSSEESAAEVDDAGRNDSEDFDLPLLRETASRTAPLFLDADEDVPVPSSIKYPQSSQSVSTRLQKTVIVDDEGEDDDDDVIPPSSSLKRRRLPVAESSDEEDDDDAPIPPSSALRRRRPAVIELDEDSDSELAGSPTKKRKTDHPATPSERPRRRLEPRASPVKPSAPKGHRSEKEKKMELLRRRRAGEKIEKLTSSESENDDERKGIYDTDSDDEFKVLKEFDDDEDEPEEEPEEEAPMPRSSRKSKGASREKEVGRGDNGEGNDEDLDDFVVEDDDGPLGAPANLSIPLEFTAAAHKPLKDQFPHVVEWLVHNKINPAFERKDPVYVNAWRKLDDEFRGLASSKFASAAWRTEFYRALKGRPRMEAYEMDAGDADKYDNCTACGRSGHPATFKIVFQGSPYYKDTLQEVESSDDEDSDEGSDDDNASVDTQGMPLPPQSREWHVGAVCCANAETAHGLIHWKHALKEWVEGRLEDEGWTSARRVQERERMKPKKRRDLANSIVDGWVERGVVRALYGDFKLTLENARNKATTGRGRMR
ncbi:hypothetical protein DL764_009284 [Monosporascus ibericus]|uniref:DUF4211 domain-containing protein n=1 Tax=Monosporascus ibericus TaxID=155417 RepID=A0A4Q4SVD6_9PEZI|nr:hypothetical protein DL764_009284 [Monosporascus ibericus]